jgi:membrane protease YdiL (CAAX protease family)
MSGDQSPPVVHRPRPRPTWQDPAVWRLWLAQGAVGALLGWLLVTVVFVVEWAAGWLTVQGAAPLAVAVGAIAIGLGRAVLVAAVEEAIFRGLVLDYLRQPIGTPAAVGVSSLAFAAAHAFNSNVNALAVANLAVAGVVFGLAFLWGKGLAVPIGLHAAWNFVEGSLYGLPVSGSGRESLLLVWVGGPELATGGAFGPEGGLVGLAAMLLTVLVMWLARTRLPGPAADAGTPAA